MKKRELNDDLERRTHFVELRVKDGGYGKKMPMMGGYAANFNQLSENLGGFREILLPGCFKNALTNSDVRALFNHNPDKILGRNMAGTLRLVEDEQGLMWECDPPDTSYSRDLQISMGRGDINQCSFGFTVAEDGDSWAKDTDGLWIRSISNMQRLFDVSPVTYPAYPSTSCAVRSMLQKQNELEEKEKRELEEANEAERLRILDVKRRKLELAERSIVYNPQDEKRVSLGYSGYNSLGTCKMCNETDCLCASCSNKEWCNMKTSDNGGVCTKMLQPSCLCLGCVNTDKAKMMNMYSM